MTPEEARDLLSGTTPGPWEWREGKDQDGEFVALRGPDGSDALRTWDGDLYASGVHGTDADKALAAAAPTLAGLLAPDLPGPTHRAGMGAAGTKYPMTSGRFARANLSESEEYLWTMFNPGSVTLIHNLGKKTDGKGRTWPDTRDMRLTPDNAREIAYTLLAAANHAERMCPMSWSPADDYDDHGNYCPAPTARTRVSPAANPAAAPAPRCATTPKKETPMTDQHPTTIGTVTGHDGTVYEVDWPPTIDTADLPEAQWEREDYCVIYQDGRQVSEFINPHWGETGFKDIDHAMELAHEYILSGEMEEA